MIGEIGNRCRNFNVSFCIHLHIVFWNGAGEHSGCSLFLTVGKKYIITLRRIEHRGGLDLDIVLIIICQLTHCDLAIARVASAVFCPFQRCSICCIHMVFRIKTVIAKCMSQHHIVFSSACIILNGGFHPIGRSNEIILRRLFRRLRASVAVRFRVIVPGVIIF